ncbi:hypothetical protein E2C01_049152 [Portunus trituberculatus]|uniref:Uncharacterized protein n=1 Tax=Portunus trituberculatus TaxID=210409 RepID=A0A5B7G4V9_PORTR|nr:hypothetical protein [Portunus trituberculatus]
MPISPASRPCTAPYKVARNTIVALPGTQHSWHLKGVTEGHSNHIDHSNMSRASDSAAEQNPPHSRLCAGPGGTPANHKPRITAPPHTIGSHLPRSSNHVPPRPLCRRVQNYSREISATALLAGQRREGTPQHHHTIPSAEL